MKSDPKAVCPMFLSTMLNLTQHEEKLSELSEKIEGHNASIEVYLENPAHIKKPDTLGKWSKRNEGPLSDIERALDDLGQAEGHLTELSVNLVRWSNTKSPVNGIPCEDIKFVDFHAINKRLEEVRLLMANAEWLMEQEEFVTFITHIEESI